MQAPRRVLQVVYDLAYGGMERLVAELACRMSSDRFESHLLTLAPPGRFGTDLGPGVRVHRAPPRGRLDMLYPRGLVREIRRIAPDVVHSHSGLWYKAAYAARLAGVPRIIHTEHGRAMPDPWTRRALDRLASIHTHAVVSVSQRLSDYLRTRIVVPGRPVTVIPNGVDTQLWTRTAGGAAVRSALGIPLTAPVIGSVGRLEPVKGYDIVLAAFRILLSEWGAEVKPTLVVAGGGSERSALDARAAEWGIAGHVRLLGWRDDLQDVLSAFSLFTMGSRSEGMPLGLLEAMACALCPVVTDVGGNREVLGPGLAHRLVPAEDPGGLAAAWRDALREPERLRADSALARQRVEGAYSLARMVGDYERLYGVP